MKMMLRGEGLVFYDHVLNQTVLQKLVSLQNIILEFNRMWTDAFYRLQKFLKKMLKQLIMKYYYVEPKVSRMMKS